MIMILMPAKPREQRKVRIGGTLDKDVVDWLVRSKGNENFSAHMNSILRQAMELNLQGISEREAREERPYIEKFQSTLNNIVNRINTLQNRLESLEAHKPAMIAARPAEEVHKRPRGRPRKTQVVEHVKINGRQMDVLKIDEYDISKDIDWYLSHDRYRKVKPEPLVNAYNMMMSVFNMGKNVTVGMLDQHFNRSEIGVPYPTFRLFYFPLIRDRLLEKGIIEKVEKAGKKGVYRRRGL